MRLYKMFEVGVREMTLIIILSFFASFQSGRTQGTSPDTGKIPVEDIKSAKAEEIVLGFIPDSLKTNWFLPRIAKKAKIKYPDLAKHKGIVGTVHLALTVDEKGHVIRTRVFRSSGDTTLDRAAKIGGSKIAFASPRMKKGEGIMTFPYRVLVGVIFRILYNEPMGRVGFMRRLDVSVGKS